MTSPAPEPPAADRPGARPPVAEWRRRLGQSLLRQLSWRLSVVFVVIGLLGGAAVWTGYRWLLLQNHRQLADETLAHVERSLTTARAQWQRNALEIRTQLDFMRLFSPDGPDPWLRLRAYFGALEGRVGSFGGALVYDRAGQVLFTYGADGEAAARRFQSGGAWPAGYVHHERQLAFQLVQEPLWLGAQGQGTLVILQPLDNATLRALAPPRSRLLLAVNGAVLASSDGLQDVGVPVAELRQRTLGRDEALWTERRSALLESLDADAQLLIWQQHSDPLPAGWLIVVATGLLGGLTLVMWLALGRWTRRTARRVAALAVATDLFADRHALSPRVRTALSAAAAESDELGRLATEVDELMQHVVAHDREHFGYLQTLDILEEGVVELDAQGRLLLASPGWYRLTGQSGLAPDAELFDQVVDEDLEGFRQQLRQLFSGEKTSLSGRIRLRREGGKELWAEFRFVPGERTQGEAPASVRGVLRDITQSYLLEKHVTHMALHDALTGLPNRVLLEDRCKMALHTAERNGLKVAIGFIDLDHFKLVNDQFGHKVGDQLLVRLSQGLRQCLRAGDTLARWGGDEFVVLLSDLSGPDDARDAVAKLVAVCRQPIRIDGNEFNPTFSIGIALYPQDAEAVETLLSQADRAMFAAKDQGRNSVCFYQEIAHRHQDPRALYIQNRLAAAIKEARIEAWYQPIVDARTQRVVSCEALARWHDATYGWVSPATFIPMAENLGLIRELGQLIWRQGIERLKQWHDQGSDVRLAVNFSRRQLFTPDFTDRLLEDLQRQSLPVQQVDLEITESVAMENADHMTKRLAELRDAGFAIAIDDFGTGYSSLSQLHLMPAQKVKIDISFVQRVHEPQGRQLIEAIVKMAHAFGLQTVAEGVENAAVAEALAAIGVDQLQGYHFGRPMSGADFERHLRAQKAPA